MKMVSSNGINVFHHEIPYKVRGISETLIRHEIDIQGRPELAEETVLIDLTPEQLVALYDFLGEYFGERL